MLNFCDFIQVIVLNHHSKQTNFAVKSIFEFSGGGGGVSEQTTMYAYHDDNVSSGNRSR